MGSLTAPSPKIALFSEVPDALPVEALRAAIVAVLAPWETRPGPEAAFHFVVQQENGGDKFLLLHEERLNKPFILASFEIRGGKIWLMRNETETDFGEALVEQGVSRQQIIPGFLPPAVRKDTGYAVD